MGELLKVLSEGKIHTKQHLHLTYKVLCYSIMTLCFVARIGFIRCLVLTRTVSHSWIAVFICSFQFVSKPIFVLLNYYPILELKYKMQSLLFL